MTVGNPVRLIIQFMIPMFLGNIFQQFYNIVDSIVAGQFIGVDALAAIGSTGSLMFFVTGWLNGLSSGFAIIVAPVSYTHLEEYITQIAFSGATEFLEKYKDKTTDDQMIGHFGLGFYLSLIHI